jgi:hypothetical protein
MPIVVRSAARALLRLLVTAVVATPLASEASAQLATYETQFSTNGIDFVSSLTQTYQSSTGAVTLTFEGLSGAAVGSSNISILGSIRGSALSGSVTFTRQPLFLRVLQGPFELTGSYVFHGVLTGTLGGFPLAAVDWRVAPVDVALLGVRYRLEPFENVQGTSPIFPPSSPTNQFNFIIAHIDASSSTISAVPEPSTYVLLGSGMLVLAGMTARRRRTVGS